MHLSVIIPAYNEEKRLPKTLSEIDKYLSQQDYQSEIIVVDGGSKDRTADMVREKMNEIKNLILIEVKNCLGKGQAVREGMLQAKGDYRIFTDADNSTNLDQVEKMWSEFRAGYDIVIGSRDIKGAVLDPPQPFLRKVIFGGGFRFLRKLIIGLWGIDDTQCGFKGFKAEVAKNIFSKLNTLGFAFDVEVLILAKKMGYKFKEVPIKWVNDPESKVKLKHVIKMLLEIIKIRLNSLKGLYAP